MHNRGSFSLIKKVGRDYDSYIMHTGTLESASFRQEVNSAHPHSVPFDQTRRFSKRRKTLCIKDCHYYYCINCEPSKARSKEGRAHNRQPGRIGMGTVSMVQ